MRTKQNSNKAPVGAISHSRNFGGKAKENVGASSRRPFYKEMTQEKGITLVALIITIIVLIILAAVTIITFTETGLLNTAARGTENYANAQTYEQEIMDNLDKYANKVIANIIGENGTGGEVTDPENPDVPPTPEESEEPELPAGWDADKVYAYKSKDNVVVPVPNGFTVSEVAGEQSVATGLVIKITQDGITSEFVWVPVADTSQMFEKVSEGVYRGKLYTSGTTPITYSATGYREPDYLTHTTSGDASETEGRGIDQLKKVVGLTGSNTEILTKWQNQLQKEFNDMKASVEKYNGFYIGRYETGNLSQTKAAVAKNNSDIANQNWYVQYQKSKTVVDGKTSMIWGCQWDAVMKWFLSSEDADTRTYVTDSTGKGNYSGTNGNKPIPTGSNDDYSVNNIYDMAGNVYDWTLEADNTNLRVLRRRLLQN